MRGFSLLELLLVLFIMGLMAASASVMTEGVDDQSRYDETRRRMALVKRAIAGDPSRSVNGQPDVSGFVADIGRPPSGLQELLEQGALPAYAQDAASGLWSGWRGPYLDVLAESGGANAFRDGYLTSGGAPDYGWGYGISASGVVALSSVTANINDDALLTVADYELPLSAVKINLHNRRGSDSVAQSNNLRLRIYYPVGGTVATAGADTDSELFSAPALSAVQSVQVSATYSPALDMPVGTRAYVVVCDDATPANRRLFDGDCDVGNPLPAATNVLLFTVVPRAQPMAFDWILQ